MKRAPKTPALAKMAMLLLFAIGAVAVLDTNTISAQELGRTITSPFGITRQTSTSESGSEGDTFVDPETGEVGHIIRNPFGVANPEGVDTGIDIPDSGEEEVGGIITSPFGVPASDDIDTGVDVFEEDEEYLISLPDDEESEEEESEDADEVDDETSDDEKEIEEESAETTSEKVLPVIDNPTRGVEYTIELSLTGSTGPAAEQYRVESTTGNIYAAPTLYVAPGGSFTLTVTSTNNQTLVKENISFYFDGTHLDALSGVFENKLYLSGSSTLTSHTFRYNVSSNVYSGTHNVAVLYCYNNNVTIVRYLKIEIKAFSILVDSNNDGAINSKDEATKRNGKLIHINNLDVDKDGIPDSEDYYRDGDQLPDSNNYNPESLPFTPLIIKVSRYLDVSNLGISFSYSFFNDPFYWIYWMQNNVDGYLRLWRKDGTTIRLLEDDCIAPSNIIPLNYITGSLVGEYIEYTLYLEAVQPCSSISEIPPVQAYLFDNNGGCLTDSVKVTPYQIVFEGIMNGKIESGIEKNALYNPCAIVKETGKHAKFHFDTIPSNISCETFNWSASDNLAFVGGHTGKSVTVRATGNVNSEFSLTIDIGRGNDWNPSIKGKILDEKTVKLFIWIVADDIDGNNPVCTVSQVRSYIREINYIFRQVGIRFTRTQINYIKAEQDVDEGGNPIDYRNPVNDHEEIRLVSYPQRTGFTREEDGLEIFFVNRIENGSTNGVSWPDDGIIIATSGPNPSTTFAHELGHACGLNDIYDDNFSSGNTVNSLWIKKDCTYSRTPNYDDNSNNELKSAAGYYTYNLSHVDLMRKLLMYGTDWTGKGDISRGNVYGIDEDSNLVDVKTGLEGMVRNPKHDM